MSDSLPERDNRVAGDAGRVEPSCAPLDMTDLDDRTYLAAVQALLDEWARAEDEAAYASL